jgi:hypothetical protein
MSMISWLSAQKLRRHHRKANRRSGQLAFNRRRMFLEPLEDRRLLAGNLNENFNGNALPATFEESGGSPAYIGGEVVFQGTIDPERRYVRTIDDNFNEVNFVAEVTVKVVNPPSPQNPATGLAFFGMGSGTPNPSSSSEPAFPSINLRHHPDTAVLGASTMPRVMTLSNVAKRSRPATRPLSASGRTSMARR